MALARPTPVRRGAHCRLDEPARIAHGIEGEVRVTPAAASNCWVVA
jgi:hypothetical protein